MTEYKQKQIFQNKSQISRKTTKRKFVNFFCDIIIFHFKTNNLNFFSNSKIKTTMEEDNNPISNDDTDISVDFSDEMDIGVENGRESISRKRNPFTTDDEEEDESDIDVGSQEFSMTGVQAAVPIESQKDRKDRRHKSRSARHGRKAKRVGQDWKFHELVRKAKDEEAKDDGVPDLDPFDIEENQQTVNVGNQPDIDLPDRSKFS